MNFGENQGLIMTKVRGIGIITEDDTDYEAVRIIIKRLTDNARISYKKRTGDGCGRIASKCLAWSNELHAQGCNVLVLIQDRDDNNEIELRNTLRERLGDSLIKIQLISIPIQELEAWLISDIDSLQKLFKLKYKPKFSGNPETIVSPKEKLRDELYRCSERRIIHLPRNNVSIASVLDINKVKDKCPSFQLLTDFIAKLDFRS